MSFYYNELQTFWEKLKNELNKQTTNFSSTSFQVTTSLERIKFPVVHGLTSGTHPSVEYFPRKWNGYEYWMAYTPYPGTANENPVIVASNDGYDWVTPSGLTNPISPTPLTGYNSDTELVYAPGNKLYCYWRWYTDEGENVLWRMESTNGTTWTNKTECVLPVDVDPLSPSILVDRSGNYQMWIGAGQTLGVMQRLTSIDGVTWSNLTPCESDIDEFGFHWHPMVWREAKYYYCLSSLGSKGQVRTAELMTDLYFGKSVDGINWEFDSNPLLMRGEQGLKNYRVYRSSAVRTGDHHKIYVSGLGAEGEQIHVMEAVLGKH